MWGVSLGNVFPSEAEVYTTKGSQQILLSPSYKNRFGSDYENAFIHLKNDIANFLEDIRQNNYNDLEKYKINSKMKNMLMVVYFYDRFFPVCIMSEIDKCLKSVSIRLENAPMVRKNLALVEFGAKLDLSIDSEGYSRIEKVSFEAYNESTCRIEAVERFRERTGCYPERVLADQIYRTRDNRNFCRDHGIRLSGPKLGRPSANTKVDKKQEHRDNTDRIEVERAFSIDKRCYGMGLITTKLEESQLTSIALSVFVSNLLKMQRRILFALLYLFPKYERYEGVEYPIFA